MVDSLNESFVPVLVFLKLFKCLCMCLFQVLHLLPEDDTSLPKHDLLDLVLSPPELILELEDPPLQVHVAPEGVLALVLAVPEPVLEARGHLLLVLQLSLQLHYLHVVVVNPIQGRQHMRLLSEGQLAALSDCDGLLHPPNHALGISTQQGVTGHTRQLQAARALVLNEAVVVGGSVSFEGALRTYRQSVTSKGTCLYYTRHVRTPTARHLL
jgi:hypothetical protein